MATTAAAGGPPHPEAACHLLYLKGLLAWKAGDVQAGLQLLERCIAKHLEMATSAPLGLDTYSIACPVRVLGIVKLMLSLVGGDPRGPTDPPSPLLAKCSRALELLVKTVGALPAAQLLRAQVRRPDVCRFVWTWCVLWCLCMACYAEHCAETPAPSDSAPVSTMCALRLRQWLTQLTRPSCLSVMLHFPMLHPGSLPERRSGHRPAHGGGPAAGQQ